jgi:NADPH:quinone reductase-like Zn-dependent oxidoreductase
MGARVTAQVGRGFGDYAVCAARAVARIPDAVTFEPAAVLRTNFATALRDRGAPAPGERLLALDPSAPTLSN